MNKVDTQIFNIASRRIVGLPLSVRVASFHFISATPSLRNLYIRYVCPLDPGQSQKPHTATHHS